MRSGVGQLILLLALSTQLFSQVKINEICSSNGDINYDPQFYNFSGWIELNNTSVAPVNIGGYFLSDDPSNPFKWQVPPNTTIGAKDFLLIWCDEKNTGLHTNFALNSKGEIITLRNASGNLIEQIEYPSQFLNMSYSRINNSNDWRISPTPTPKSQNVNGPKNGRLSAPEFSIMSGRYGGSISLQISSYKSGAEIRYTTNGSEPRSNSLKYGGSIKLSKTTVVKAAVFHPDYLPSEVVSHSYLIDEHNSKLPIVSISTNPQYLWDNQIGIYTDGTNGANGNCAPGPRNWNQDWDRHAVFEYLDQNGKTLLNQHLDIRIGGACSRNQAQKSFVLRARNEYGTNTFDYSFFKSKRRIDEFGGLFLRNSGNDFNNLMFRDAFIQRLGSSAMDIDYMAYQPTVFYLNGEYWGIQNLREKIDGDFIESNFGVDKDDVDLLETYENAIEGDASAWQSYKNTLQTLNPNDPATFQFINEHIDVQEYINYLVTEIYVCNTDWPGNNVKFWRQRSTNGKFRWILWDTDFGYGLYSGTSYPTHPTLNFATDPNQSSWPNPAFSTLHIRLVLANPEFRSRFISTFSTAMASAFHPNAVNQKLTDFASVIADEVPYHKTRWWGNIGDWYYQLQQLLNFSNARYAFMQTHLTDFFGLGDPVKFNVNVLPSGSGKVNLNGVDVNEIIDGPYFKNVVYNAKPVPNAGFEFKNWIVTSTGNEYIPIAATGDAWKYFDQGSLPSIDWNLTSYDDTGWSSGNSQLGYGDGDENTVVSYGADANNKFVTTYFRRSFTIDDLSDLNDINASVLFDDGAVVYFNGTEVFRNNLPAGSISFSTYAQSAITENAPFSFTIDKNLLVLGENTIAVEVHQVSGNSSDISFDFVASTTRSGESQTITVNDINLIGTAYSDVSITANFEEVKPIEGLVLNEISAVTSFAKDEDNDQDDWIELFNGGNVALDLNNVMITDDLSWKDKHVLKRNTPWLLQPGSYQILWADNQPEQGENHLTFKLSKDGEQLGLYYAVGFDTTVFAEVDYDRQLDGFSYSRIPNGVGDFTFTPIITPASENVYKEVKTSFYPNPVDDVLNVIELNETLNIIIYNSMGSIVYQGTITPPYSAHIDTKSLVNGLYFAKLTSDSINKIERLVVLHP